MAPVWCRLVAFACVALVSSRAHAQEVSPRVACRIVTAPHDADTLRCEGMRESVRWLGVDAPELAAAPFGELARDAVRARLPIGSVAWLAFDVRPRDRYGRVLAYVWTAETDGEMLNVWLVGQGLAVAAITAPNVAHAEAIRAAAATAQRDRRGLWSVDAFACTPADFRAKRC